MTNDPTLHSPTAQRGYDPLVSKFLSPHNAPQRTREPSDATRSSRTTSYDDDSRASTPDSQAGLHVNFAQADRDRDWNEKPENAAAAQRLLRGSDDSDAILLVGAAGRLPDDVYDRTLSWWRAGVRRAIVRCVERETQWLAAMQSRVRRPILDRYFVYTSTLGTHTFFMVMLPLFHFFGAQEFGRGLLLMLAVGVYVTSFMKDLFCCPRPYAPPVTRLTLGSHHLEYGFPSTHSTNSVSIALFIYTLVRRLYTTPVSTAAQSAIEGGVSYLNGTTAGTVAQAEGAFSTATYGFLIGVLIFYVFSIVYGRLYTAMHSFTDCIAGMAIGAGIWGLHILVGEYVDSWVRTSGWIVPAVIVPLCLFLVHRHPQPVDDCPCFEDAIAFISVVMGEFLARWYMHHHGYDATFFVHPMPGSTWATWSDVAIWWSVAAIKMVIGILTIVIWRMAAKSFCHFILPPTFRFLSHLFTLPNRRFYTPATDYTSVPADKGLRPIPSVIDLPGMVEYEVDGVGAAAAAASTARRNASRGYGAIKQRAGRSKLDQELEISEKNAKGEDAAYPAQDLWTEPRGKGEDAVKHYDADVLTKVFVYCGIGMLGGGAIPVMFELLGWGVKTS
ncbi:PAP2-domain-containing protein [Trametes coccinea BRFM310]|uniref:PAP2-domain-containing protein n=1 Tax=Trametes coccinea (strain BRFM310) TaxID=1353009 RepID=A0A1Y2IPR6_TRAC3|nr:PAP2-domain-containing protein [Trametes coccinea BRFM310]